MSRARSLSRISKGGPGGATPAIETFAGAVVPDLNKQYTSF